MNLPSRIFDEMYAAPSLVTAAPEAILRYSWFMRNFGTYSFVSSAVHAPSGVFLYATSA